MKYLFALVIFLAGCGGPSKTPSHSLLWDQGITTKSHCIAHSGESLYGIGVAEGSDSNQKWVVFEEGNVVDEVVDERTLTEWAMNVQCWVDGKGRLNYIWPGVVDDNPNRTNTLLHRVYDFDGSGWSGIENIWPSTDGDVWWQVDGVSLYVDEDKNPYFAFRRTEPHNDAVILSHVDGKWDTLILSSVYTGESEETGTHYFWSGLPSFFIDESGRYFVSFTHDLQPDAGPGNPQSVYVVYSDNKGESWSPAILVNNSNGSPAYQTRLWENNNQINVLWVERSGAAYGLGYSYSSDGGNTWSEKQRIPLNPGSRAWLSVCDNQVVLGDISGRHLSYAYLIEEDNTWSEAINLNEEFSPFTVLIEPAMACDGEEALLYATGYNVDEKDAEGDYPTRMFLMGMDAFKTK